MILLLDDLNFYMLSSKVKVSQNKKDLVFKRLGKKTYILDVRTGEIHSLNKTAAIIWELSKKPVAIKQIANKIIEKFDVSKKQAEKDTKEFIEKYLKLDFLIRH